MYVDSSLYISRTCEQSLPFFSELWPLLRGKHCVLQTLFLVGFTSFHFHPKVAIKRDDFDFDMVIYPVLDGDVPYRPSCVVHFQLIRCARVCSQWSK